jgi:hypothetical protein
MLLRQLGPFPVADDRDEQRAAFVLVDRPTEHRTWADPVE